MAAIVTLPSELLDHILGDLPKQDVSACMQTCSRLYNALRPVLYQSIECTWTEDTPKTPRVHHLLRSIAEEPSLADLVQELSLEPVGDYITATKFRWRGQAYTFKPADLPSINKAVRRSNLPDPEKWEAAVTEYVDAAVAVLIAQLRRLRRMSIGRNLLLGGHHLRDLFHHLFALTSAAAGTPHVSSTHFQHLRHVTLGTAGDGLHAEPDHTLPALHFYTLFLCLPHLRTASLQLERLRHMEYPDKIDPHSAAASRPRWDRLLESAAPLAHLTTLRLIRTRACPEVLASILSAAPAVTHLQYDFVAAEPTRTFDCAELGAALVSVRGGLAALDIRYTDPPNNLYVVEKGSRRMRGTLGGYGGEGLPACAALETLQVPFVMLLGWYPEGAPRLADVLPRGLRRLCVRDDLWEGADDWSWWDGPMMRVFVEFLAQGAWKEVCPALEELELCLLNAWNEQWDPPAREAFRALVEGQGLRCTIVKAEDDGPASDEGEWVRDAYEA